MAENILVSHEWKHTLETTPNKSVTSLVSIYDLIYNSNGTGTWIKSEKVSNAGTKLDHDIICLNKNMLKNGGIVDTVSSPNINGSLWFKYGIDIALPKYDKRAKQKIIPCAASFEKESSKNKSVETFSIFPSEKMTIYDKDSALVPEDMQSFINLGVFRNQKDMTSAPTWESYSPPKIGSAADENPEIYDIILGNQDVAFQSTLVTQAGFFAYNKMFLNPSSSYYALLLIRLLGLNLDIFNIDDTEYSKITIDSSDINLIDNIPKSSIENPKTIADTIRSYMKKFHNWDDTEKGDVWEYLLKNTFVWVRCPFYGDYIEPSSFEQDLHNDAKVVHSELMLSGAGDFKKYDKFLKDIEDGNSIIKDSLSEKVNSSERTQPYIPTTSPTVDFYTSEFLDMYLKEIHKPASDGNFSSKIKTDYEGDNIKDFLDNYVSGNDSVIKGIPIAPINRADADAEAKGAKNLLPPNYFDPESRYSDDEYKKMGKFPTILPLDGNIYVDGRIIGPTIDEIWYMLKKLVGGRPSDIVSKEDESYLANDKDKSQATKLDMGIPFGEGELYKNDTDTTLSEVPESEFNFEYEDSRLDKYGDPIGYEYKSTDDKGNGKRIVINKFINQNNSIVYPVFQALKDLSSRITEFDKSENNDRQICNFTAWNSFGENPENDRVEDKETVITGVWKPRNNPYSLRELEALLLGTKFNLITFSRFVKENFGVTGGLGKEVISETDDHSNDASGSLYQFHKNYNYKIDDPNTFYNQKGTATGLDDLGGSTGIPATVDDNDSRTPEEKERLAIRYHIDYGTSKAISPNQDFYSSSDVYLAADGTWRYVGDHVRIPILKCDY